MVCTKLRLALPLCAAYTGFTLSRLSNESLLWEPELGTKVLKQGAVRLSVRIAAGLPERERPNRGDLSTNQHDLRNVLGNLERRRAGRHAVWLLGCGSCRALPLLAAGLLQTQLRANLIR